MKVPHCLPLTALILSTVLMTSCSSGDPKFNNSEKNPAEPQDTTHSTISAKENVKGSLPDSGQVIVLTSPKSGEKLVKGSTYKITWRTSTAFDSAYPQVMITLITAKGQQGVGPNQQIIAKNTGSVEWTVPTAKLQGDIQSGPAKPYTLRPLNDDDEFQLLIEGYPHITGRAEGPFDYSDGFWIVSK